MRKSTLITTIAMIVVVVVALSTATFAWFTSSTVSKVTQVISSQASSGLILSQGEVAPNTGLITWSPATEEITIQATAQDNLNGLWAPRAKLDKYITDNSEGNASLSGSGAPVGFLSCIQTKDGPEIDAGGSKELLPIMLRIVNGTSDASDVYLTVIIKINTTDAAKVKSSKFAAAALTFYANIQDQATESTSNTGTIYTLGYQAATAANTTAGTAVTAGAEVDPTPNVSGTRPTYSNAGTNSTNFISAGAGLDSYGVAQNDTILSYYMKLATGMASNEGINLVLYSWLDGWLGNDTVKGCELNIIYIISQQQIALQATT